MQKFHKELLHSRGLSKNTTFLTKNSVSKRYKTSQLKSICNSTSNYVKIQNIKLFLHISAFDNLFLLIIQCQLNTVKVVNVPVRGNVGAKIFQFKEAGVHPKKFLFPQCSLKYLRPCYSMLARTSICPSGIHIPDYPKQSRNRSFHRKWILVIIGQMRCQYSKFTKTLEDLSKKRIQQDELF